jgi:hypothetical protein
MARTPFRSQVPWRSGIAPPSVSSPCWGEDEDEGPITAPRAIQDSALSCLLFPLSILFVTPFAGDMVFCSETQNPSVRNTAAVVKIRHAAALALLGWFVFTPALSSAGSHAKALKTFTAPDGAFSFRYSNELIHCEQKRQGFGEDYYWTPDICTAYHPTCDGLANPGGHGQTSIACFAYPKNRFTDTQAFEAATFSVEVVDEHSTAKSCLAGPVWEGLDVDKHGTTRINGVSFARFELGEGGMNQGVDVKLYRTFHNGKCYQLGIDEANAAAVVFDPPAKEADWDEVERTFEQTRKSFRFLK